MDVTDDARSDVLLQPQYFGNASFDGMKFTQKAGVDINQIIIYPRLGRAEMTFMNGENPLSGMPKEYDHYNVYCWKPAKISIENVHACFEWTNARKLTIQDKQNIAGDLMNSINELSKLTKLEYLQLHMHRYTYRYKGLKVEKFINSLPSLKQIYFFGYDITYKQSSILNP